MKPNAREGQSRSGTSGSRIKQQKHQSIGRQAKTPSQAPPALKGFLRSLTLDNTAGAAVLRRQCEDGTVRVSVFIKLLDWGYRKPPKGEPIKSTRMPYIGKDGRPWDWEERQRAEAAQVSQTTRIQSFTLGNPVVRRRLQREWENGTMHPVLRGWLIRHGRELLLKQPKQKFRMPYVGRHGLPWEYDVMKDQQDAAIKAQEEQQKAEALAQPSSEGTAPSSDGEDDDAENQNVPELVQDKDYDLLWRRIAPRDGQLKKL